MKMWRKTIDIKPFISEDDSPAGVKAAVAGVTGLLESELTSPFVFERAHLKEMIERFHESEDVDDFNDILDDLYDWADRNRVWLGLKS